MTTRGRTRFPISFDRWYALLSSALLLPPSSSYVGVDEETVEVRMGWAFRSRFPRTAVASVLDAGIAPLSRGVHGFAGRWLVNGAGRGILRIDLNPRQRAHVMGFPVRLDSLFVSMVDPAALRRALREPPSGLVKAG
jgi:hypothetical protein